MPLTASERLRIWHHRYGFYIFWSAIVVAVVVARHNDWTWESIFGLALIVILASVVIYYVLMICVAIYLDGIRLKDWLKRVPDMKGREIWADAKGPLFLAGLLAAGYFIGPLISK